MYSCPHINIDLKDQLFNVAIPMHSVGKDPYCLVRTQQFEFTKPIKIEVSKWGLAKLSDEPIKVYKKFKEVDEILASMGYHKINSKGEVVKEE